MRKQLKQTLIASVIGVGILAASNSVMANASSRPVFSREAQMLYSEAVHSFRTRHFTLAKKLFPIQIPASVRWSRLHKRRK